MPISLSDWTSLGGGTPSYPVGPISIGSTYSTASPEEVEKIRQQVDAYKNVIAQLAKTSENATKQAAEQTRQIRHLQRDIERSRQEFRNAELRSIEVIGIISSIIALVLGFIQTANSHQSLSSGYFILLTATCALVLFASLLHYFLNRSKMTFGAIVTTLVIPISIIAIVGLAIGLKWVE